jgi:hypothetical protein
VLERGEDADGVRRDPADAEVVHSDERADAAPDGDERDVDDRDPRVDQHLLGPEITGDQLVVEVAGLGC